MNPRASTTARFPAPFSFPETQLHTSEKNRAHHRKKITSLEMPSIKRDVA